MDVETYPQGAGDESPSGDEETVAPVDCCHSAAFNGGFKGFVGHFFGFHEHRVGIAAEKVGIDESGADVGEGDAEAARAR